MSASDRSYIEDPMGSAGRPFVINDEIRVAKTERRSDWCDAECEVQRPGPELSQQLAAAWLADAQMEHASVAAFSRHLLQLIALGAPADLIDDTQHAIRDGFEHAKACFALARAYGGDERGPAPFPLDDAKFSYDLLAVVGEVILEGCIGETVAAMTADHAAARATVPRVRGTLAKLAADELHHSLLAWRFVRWARSQDPEGVNRLISTTIGALTKREKPEPEPEPEPDCLAHGRLGNVRRRQIRRAAIQEVVLPLLRSMRASGRTFDGGPLAA